MNNLLKMRLSCRLTQVELGHLLALYYTRPVSPSLISRHENGEVVPSGILKQAYSKVFKIPEEALFDESSQIENLMFKHWSDTNA